MIRLPKFLSFLSEGRKPGEQKMKPADAVCGIFTVQKNGSLLMMKRSGDMKFLPGYDAFPWTKINRGGKHDGDMDKSIDGNLDDRSATAKVKEYLGALFGYVKETLGADMEKLLSSGVIDSIGYLGNDLTPDYDIHRFRTHYFLIECREEFPLPLAKGEVPQVSAGWQTAGELWKKFKEGGMLMAPVMNGLLGMMRENGLKPGTSMEQFSFFDSGEVPVIEPVAGVLQMMPMSCTFPPINRTNCLVLGDEGRGQGYGKVMIDPSPVSMDEFKRLVRTIESKDLDISTILITHHHRDHHQGVEMLAKKLSVKVLMSGYTQKMIAESLGKSHFDNIEVKTLKEGDTLTYWQDKRVKVYEIPGHDQGQLGIAPESMEWFLAGDLIQGAGTVVIGSKEGDMAKYFESMQRIVDLNPAVVFPSHGMPQGTPFLVKQTLAHRLLREKQVLSLYKKGKTPEQMVRAIYPSINRYLRRLALENVNAHLRKLKQEEVI